MKISLDNKKVIARYDKSEMIKTLEAFPDQVRDAKEIGQAFNLPDSYRNQYRNVVCTGLGGSAIGADMARSYLADEIKIPMIVNRNYTLPAFVGENSLVIVSSYSGNTEETISAYRDARSKKARIMVITSGGELQKFAKDDGYPYLVIPKGFQPRCALGYSFFPLLILLSKAGLIKDKAKDIDSAINTMEALRNKKLGNDIAEKKNPAKQIARELYMKFPVIYASQDHMDVVATRWRGQIAENSKTIGSSHVFPELTHNEIVGWKHPKRLLKKLVAVILRDAGDHARIAKRMDIAKKIIASEKAKVVEVHSVGGDLLARTFSLVYMGDFVSFYLAVLNTEDPTPVERIKFLKEELAKS